MEPDHEPPRECEPLRERALLDRFRRGDRAALAVVYAAHA